MHQRLCIAVAGWQTNALLSALIVYAAELLRGLFHTNPQWVALVALLIMTDLATGMLAARRRRERLHSSKMRCTINKIIQYNVFLALLTAIINSFTNSDFLGGVVGALDDFGHAYVALTELKSIAENTAPDSPMLRLWAALRRHVEKEADTLVDPPA